MTKKYQKTVPAATPPAVPEQVSIVMDEIAADTDPREGAALASAILEDLLDRGATVLVTGSFHTVGDAIWQFQLEFGTGLPGLTGRQVSIDPANPDDPDVVGDPSSVTFSPAVTTRSVAPVGSAVDSTAVHCSA